MKCEECCVKEANFLCIECDQALCKDCDELLHRGGRRKAHFRPFVCKLCKSQAALVCMTCNFSLCSNCQSEHIFHSLKELAPVRRVGVFWDVSSCRPMRSEDIQNVMSELCQSFGEPLFIKTYGDPWGKWRDVLTSFGAICVNRPGIKLNESLLLDLSISLNSGLTHVLLISAQSQFFFPHVLQLKSNMPAIEFLSSSKILPLNVQEMLGEGIKLGKNAYIGALVAYLRDEAFKGNILIGIDEFLQTFSVILKADISEVGKLLDLAEKRKVVMISKKDFDKFSSSFISLKVESLSIECLIWTLRSLKLDEMLPSEKAIQARIREVFDYKIQEDEWQNLMLQVRGHSYSKSAPSDFSLFSKPLSQSKFILKEAIDPLTSSKTLLIYPSDETWDAFDNYSKQGDYLSIKETFEWKEFLKFLENYFSSKPKKLKKDEEQKAIPGGRYGCAQFIKICGPASLRNCSLGKLSYMIQVAINEDFLRYQRTLLVWTSNSRCSLPSTELAKKLQVIKNSVISLLEKSPEGISLAQLPLHLKKLLNFPLNITELGFPKLKDLLATFPEVAIEVRDTSQPFAILCKNKTHALKPDSVISCILAILREMKAPIAEHKLESELVQKLGRIDWSVYSTSSLSEFIVAYDSDSFELLKKSDCYWISISKKSAQPGTKNYPFFLNNSFNLESQYGARTRPVFESGFEDKAHEPGDASTDFSYSFPTIFSNKGAIDSFQYGNQHFKAKSENIEDVDFNKYSQYSWLDYSYLKPPPGFE